MAISSLNLFLSGRFLCQLITATLINIMLGANFYLPAPESCEHVFFQYLLDLDVSQRSRDVGCIWMAPTLQKREETLVLLVL